MREENERKTKPSISSDIELDAQYYLNEQDFNINDEIQNN